MSCFTVACRSTPLALRRHITCSYLETRAIYRPVCTSWLHGRFNRLQDESSISPFVPYAEQAQARPSALAMYACEAPTPLLRTENWVPETDNPDTFGCAVPRAMLATMIEAERMDTCSKFIILLPDELEWL